MTPATLQDDTGNCCVTSYIESPRLGSLQRLRCILETRGMACLLCVTATLACSCSGESRAKESVVTGAAAPTNESANVATLIARLNHTDVRVRQAAASRLALIAQPEVEQALLAALSRETQKPGHGCTVTVIDAVELQRLDSATTPLEELVGTNIPLRVLGPTLRALGRRGSPKGHLKAEWWLRSKQPQPEYAMAYFAAIGSDESRSILTRELERTTSTRVRGEILCSLVLAKEETAIDRAMELLKKLLGKPKQDWIASEIIPLACAALHTDWQDAEILSRILTFLENCSDEHVQASLSRMAVLGVQLEDSKQLLHTLRERTTSSGD